MAASMNAKPDVLALSGEAKVRATRCPEGDTFGDVFGESLSIHLSAHEIIDSHGRRELSVYGLFRLHHHPAGSMLREKHLRFQFVQR